MENKELEPKDENMDNKNNLAENTDDANDEISSSVITAPTEEEKEKSDYKDLKSEEIFAQKQKSEKTEKKESKSSENQKKVNKKKPASKSANAKKKKSKKKKSRVNNSVFSGIIVVTVVLTLSVVLAVKGISIGMEYWGVGKSENAVTFNIPQGASNEEIADILKENGIIESQDLFKIALKISKPKALYPGDITLKPSMGYSTVIENLAQMRQSYKTVKVTIPEGSNLLTIAKLLEKNSVCSADDFLFEFNKDQGFGFEKKLDTSKDAFYRMEGYFVPDTYEFYVEDSSNNVNSAYNVTKVIREQFVKVYTDDIYKQIEKSGMTLNQVMTLASIVQLEAADIKQMPYVASVFINRLNNKTTFPKLQSDTTKNYVRNVIKKQAESDASVEHYTKCYDTYQCDGLPAGPVCNPGIDAVKAVLNPAKTDYYYFCNNLKTKKTYYAKTLKQHEKNLKAAGLKK